MKLLIVEDQAMFREAIRKVCVRELKHTVVGECGTGEEAVALILKLRPDVTLLDLSLPDIDGLAVLDRVRQKGYWPRVLILSSHCDDYTLFRVERAEVSGFVDKNVNTSEVLAQALNLVGTGKCYFSEVYQSVREARRKNPRAFPKVLTEWEQQILALIGLGLSDEEISQRLGRSWRTVQTHRSNILRKLKLPGTPKLIRFAIEHGFTALEERPKPPSAER
jgi:DNA-binding NarL/FixJ family response regulator